MALEDELRATQKLQQRSNELLDALMAMERPQLERMNDLLEELLTVMRPMTEWFRILSSPRNDDDVHLGTMRD